MSLKRTLLGYACCILSACSSTAYLFSDTATQINTNSPQAETQNKIMLWRTQPNSPCPALRASNAQSRLNYIRCDVVINPKVVPDAMTSVKEADVCLATGEQQEGDKKFTYAELTGRLVKIENETEQSIHSINVRALDSVEREPSSINSVTKVNDVLNFENTAPLSGDTQSVQYEPELQELSYHVYKKENFLLGLSSRPIPNIYVRLKCAPDIVY